MGSMWLSDIEEDRWLVRVLHLLDTEDGSVHLIVDPGQISHSRALSDSAELIIHTSVAQTNPTLVRAQVRHRDAAQMRADSRAAHHGRVSSIRHWGLWFFIKLSRGRESIGLIDLRFGETSDEDKVTIPRGLKHLTRGKLRDVELLVSITNVSVASNHLIVQHSHKSLHSEDIVAEDKTLNHVHLSTFDLIVTVFFVPDSTAIRQSTKVRYIWNIYDKGKSLLTCSHQTSYQPWSWHRGGLRSCWGEMRLPSTWDGHSTGNCWSAFCYGVHCTPA